MKYLMVQCAASDRFIITLYLDFVMDSSFAVCNSFISNGKRRSNVSLR